MQQTGSQLSNAQTPDAKGSGTLATIATFFAAVSASCCILPLGLSVIGLGGSWLTFLSPFVQYRDIILVFVGLIIALSWYKIWKSSNGANTYKRGVILTSIATLIYLGALSTPFWEDQVARSLWQILRQQS